jgi:amino-acid N-acetyltransferase
MIRKAKIQDIKQLHKMINSFAAQGLMLPKSLNELYENIRDFWVAQDHGKISGCCALHISWNDLAEIKSLGVAKKSRGKGTGRELLAACIDEARGFGVKNLFVLTYKQEFFKKFGFKKIKHAELPHKIWAECINCCKFPDCREVALLKVL